MKGLRASASRSIAAAPATARWRCATPPAIRTPPITGSIKTSLMCSAARRSATNCATSRRRPTTRSTRGRRRRRADKAPALHLFARIVRLVALPFLHQLVELGVALFRQHDADGGEQIAAARFRREALALETKRASARGPRRHRDLDRLVERRHPHLGAERRLVERDRQVEPHVGAVEREDRMRRDRDGDQQVTGAGLPGHALTFEPDMLAVHNADRNLDVDVLAVGQVQPLGRAVGRVHQRHRHFGLHVGADAEILRLEIGAATAGGAAEGFAQNILEAAEPAAAPAPAAGFSAAPAPGGAGEPFRTEAESLEIGVAAEAGARVGAAAAAKTLEAVEARLALGIDLAAIERLALVLVFEEFVGGVELGKAR